MIQMNKLMVEKDKSNFRSLSKNNKQAKNGELAFKNIFEDKKVENNKLDRKDSAKEPERLDKKKAVETKEDDRSEEESLDSSKKAVNDEVLVLLASLFLELGELENPEEEVELLEELELVLEMEGLVLEDDEIVDFLEGLDLDVFEDLDDKEVFIKDKISSKLFEVEATKTSEEDLIVVDSDSKLDKNLLAMDRLERPIKFESSELEDEIEFDQDEVEILNQVNEPEENGELRSRKDHGNSTDLSREDMSEESSLDLDINSLGQGLDFELNISRDKNPILEDMNTMVNPDFQEIDEEDLIGQVINKMDFNLEENKNEVRINLKPENLGKMLMNLELSKGEVVAKIVVDNHRTKEVLENNIMVLQEELEETGVEIKSFEVFVGNNSDFDRHQGENQHFFNQGKKFKTRPSKNVLNRISADYEAATIEEEAGIISVPDGRMDLLA